MTQRAVFLDRDGTLHVERDFCRRPEELAVFDGVRDALWSLRDAGYRLVVLTNQSGIARGYLDEAMLARIHAELQARLDGAIDAFFHCPHLPEPDPAAGPNPYVHPCTCRKPAGGLLRQAMDLLDLSPRGSWVIGDSARDLLATREQPVRRLLVRSGKPVEASLRELARLHCEPEAVLDDLPAAARFILAAGRPPRDDTARSINAPRA